MRLFSCGQCYKIQRLQDLAIKLYQEIDELKATIRSLKKEKQIKLNVEPSEQRLKADALEKLYKDPWRTCRDCGRGAMYLNQNKSIRSLNLIKTDDPQNVEIGITPPMLMCTQCATVYFSMPKDSE